MLELTTHTHTHTHLSRVCSRVCARTCPNGLSAAFRGNATDTREIDKPHITRQHKVVYTVNDVVVVVVGSWYVVRAHSNVADKSTRCVTFYRPAKRLRTFNVCFGAR